MKWKITVKEVHRRDCIAWCSPNLRGIPWERTRSCLSGKVVMTDIVCFWDDLDFSTTVDFMMTTEINMGGNNIGAIIRMRASQLDVQDKLGRLRISVGASRAGGGWMCTATNLG